MTCDGAMNYTLGRGGAGFCFYSFEGYSISPGAVPLNTISTILRSIMLFYWDWFMRDSLVINRLFVQGDSMLVICQSAGIWHAWDPELIELRAQIWKPAMEIVGESAIPCCHSTCAQAIQH